MNIRLIKDTLSGDYQRASWVHDGNDVVLDFPFEIHAIYSARLNRIVVEMFGRKKIGFYKASGELDVEVAIPDIEDYQFRGINKNNKSVSGVSLLFLPLVPRRSNEWGDIEQYELKIENESLGRYLDIYR